MEEWNEHSEKVTKITPDREKARSLLQLVALREKDIKTKAVGEFATLIVEGYYEIVKELITAILSVDGYKTISHELLIAYLAEFYKEFSSADVYLLDQLRKTRNDIAYRGVMIKPEYLHRNAKRIEQIIALLKTVVNKKVGVSS